jgi:hypothetical protein
VTHERLRIKKIERQPRTMGVVLITREYLVQGQRCVLPGLSFRL